MRKIKSNFFISHSETFKGGVLNLSYAPTND
jgi:hypothetical protein